MDEFWIPIKETLKKQNKGDSGGSTISNLMIKPYKAHNLPLTGIYNVYQLVVSVMIY